MHNNKKSYFWTIQVAAWVLVGVLNYAVQHISSGDSLLIVLNMLGITVGGFIVTSVYRYYLKKKVLPLPRQKLFGFILLSTVILAVVWFTLLVLIFLPVMEQYNIRLLPLSLNLVPLSVLILVWNLFYFGVHLLRRYHQTEVEKWKLEAEVQKARWGALKSQINPHFLFNALNNIRALILVDPAAARVMLSGFADILRYSLQQTENREVTLEEELQMLKQYLQLVKLQYEDKIAVEILCDEVLYTETLPPMMLQLLAENAIKHGISQSSTGGKLYIRIAKDNGCLQLEVKNPGSLKSTDQLEESLGIGLQNIGDRLSLLYGDKASLSLQEQNNEVMVSIQIPKT